MDRMKELGFILKSIDDLKKNIQAMNEQEIHDTMLEIDASLIVISK